MGGKRGWLTYAVLGGYFIALLMFQSRLTWENFDRQIHITRTPRPPFTLGPYDLVLNVLGPEATAAGLAHGDRLIALDGAAARGQQSVQAAMRGARAGEIMPAKVQRDGRPLSASVRLAPLRAGPLSLREWILFLFRDVLTPWLCLVLGFGVAFQRPSDPLAWLLLLLLMSFGGVAQAGGVMALVAGWELPTRPLAVFYYLTITNSWGFWMILFGQYFPPVARSGWDRMIRWSMGGVLAVYALLWGLSNTLAVEDARAMPFEAAVQRWSTLDVIVAIAGIGVFFVNIALKMRRSDRPDARRRLKLLMSGAAVSLTPVVLLASIALVIGRPLTAFVTFSPWLWVPSLLLLFLFPATLAYVIVVARAMELNVVIRQGLQYALAREGARLLMASLFFTMWIYSIRLSYQPDIARLRLLLSLLIIAACLLALRAASGRIYDWIDRHFFREAVNTERVLAALSEKVRTIVEIEPLLETVTETVSSALHIDRVAALVRCEDDFVPAYARGFGAEGLHLRVPANSPLVERLGHDRQPLRGDAAGTVRITAVEDRQWLKILRAELLLPLMTSNRLLGLLSLGPKRSEAPYSASDIRLLEAVAGQTGLALENSRLTAEMAREIADRERMARELEIARDVQQQLFPQQTPPVKGLDYAGKCRPASTVGGDYYDFLPARAGQVGFAIGDVSGKGVPAALLMASLRASLRGLAIAYSGDIAQLMTDLNRLIYEASSSDWYATFFFGLFDPDACMFHYVNAGHNAPVLLRGADGTVQRLNQGGLMIGAFPSAHYQEGSVALEPGDTIVMFTDGITEAMNRAGEEFGEQRLIATIRRIQGLGAADLIEQLLREVDTFAASTSQYDDITLVVIRVL